ncbi:Putrescine importer PuuP [Budvicia aquatica]|uniref:Putrescine importer PuuP n=1 Tax=Budvicia aquatica TaxID=82979 RepID=A0A484ZPD7_9GAMM|nr:Putrescine importer PuuP [Budvicia aquatica]
MHQEAARMKRVLTTPALVFFGLAYMVPLGIFTTYGQVTVLSQGHLPVAYIITLAAILFTALSYCRMTSQLPLSGSAYSYVQKTFGGQSWISGWLDSIT